MINLVLSCLDKYKKILKNLKELVLKKLISLGAVHIVRTHQGGEGGFMQKRMIAYEGGGRGDDEK